MTTRRLATPVSSVHHPERGVLRESLDNPPWRECPRHLTDPKPSRVLGPRDTLYLIYS